MIKLNLIKPKRFATVEFTRQDLLQIGAKAIDTIQRRCALGLNVHDRPAKPLSPGYRAKKTAKGKPGIRDLMHSGGMLGALTVVEATDNRVTVGFTRQAELVKAIKNEQRDPWFGASKNDEAKIMLLAEKLLAQKVSK